MGPNNKTYIEKYLYEHHKKHKQKTHIISLLKKYLEKIIF